MPVLITALFMYLGLAANWSNLITDQYREVAIMSCALLVLGWLVVRTWRRWTWYRTALDQVLILWLVAFSLSLLANGEVWRRIVIGLWFSGLYIALWYLLHDCLSNGALKREALVDGVLLAGTGILISGYAEVVRWVQAGRQGAAPVLLSTLDNPNPLATVLVVLLYLAIGRLFTLRSVWRIGMGLYVLLTAIALFMTLSRGAWIAAGAGLVVFALLLLAHFKVRLNWPVVLGLVAVGGLVVVGVTLYRGWDGNGRLSIYNAALQMFREKPLTGYGLYTFGRGLLRIVGVIPTTTTHAHAHNLILNIAAELGIVGLIAFGATVLVFARAMRAQWRAVSDRSQLLLAGAIAAVVGVGVHHLFDVTALLPAVAFCALIPLVVSVTPQVSEQRQPVSVPRLRYVLTAGLALVILLAGVWDTYTYSLYYTAIGYSMKTGDAQKTLDLLQPAINDDPAMPVYHLMQAYFLQYTNPEAERSAFQTVCALEPDYAATPYDGQVAILHYLRLSLYTPNEFWIANTCHPAVTDQ